jgi:hypothetical protein
MVRASSPWPRTCAWPRGPWGRREELRPLGPEDAQDRVHQRGLAHPGPAGDHEHLGAQRQAHGLGLDGRKAQARALLDPGQRLSASISGLGQGALTTSVCTRSAMPRSA